MKSPKTRTTCDYIRDCDGDRICTLHGAMPAAHDDLGRCLDHPGRNEEIDAAEAEARALPRSILCGAGVHDVPERGAPCRQCDITVGSHAVAGPAAPILRRRDRCAAAGCGARVYGSRYCARCAHDEE